MRLLIATLCAGALLLTGTATIAAPAAAGPTLPTVVETSQSPPDDVNVPASANVRVVFSTAMNKASVQAALWLSDGLTGYTAQDGSSSWTATYVPNDTFTFNPNLDFASGARINVTINGAIAKDLAGNPLDGNKDGIGGDSYRFRFTVALDPTPPKVLAVQPPNGALSVSVAATIVVQFSKAMNRNASAAGFSYPDGVKKYGPPNGTFTWSGVNVPDDRMEFNPDENLRTSATYTVRLNASQVRDRNGFSLDGDGNGTAEGTPKDDFIWVFKVEPVDRTPPTVRATDPINWATGIRVVTSITITFSERMNRTALVAGFSYTDGMTVWGAESGNSEWSLGDEVYRFTPSQSLAPNTQYIVKLNGAVVTDLAGNRLGNFSFTFRTAPRPDTTPPDIVSTDPWNGEPRVPRNPLITVVFSEAMNRPSVLASIAVSGGVTAVGFAWPNEKITTFTTSATLAYDTRYTVIVFSTAKDLAGNRMLQARTFSFTTTPWIGPVSGEVLDPDGHPVAKATVSLGARALQTNSSGGFVFEGIESGVYSLSIAKTGYEPYSETVAVGEAFHDLGAIRLREATGDPGLLPWATLGAVIAAAGLIVFFLRRRPKVVERPAGHWRPAEAVVIPPDEPRPKP